jgi:streptogramin lyase
MKLARTVAMSVLVLHAVVFRPSAFAAEADDLFCHRVDDTLEVDALLDVVASGHPEFARNGCTLTRAVEVCTPATPSNLTPPPPFTAIAGKPLSNDYVCYAVRCPAAKRSDSLATDPFGARVQRSNHPLKLCVPARIGPAPCARVASRQCGGECPDPIQQCTFDDVDKQCVCLPPLPGCSVDAGGVCGGTCPNAADACHFDAAGRCGCRLGALLTIDAESARVLRYDGTTGAFVDVLVSSGSGGLQTPQNLTIGPDGRLYVSSWGNGSILRYDAQTGAFIDAFVPSGRGGLAHPDQLLFGPDGNLYVSDRFAGAIRRYQGTTGAFIDSFVSDFRLNGFVGFAFGPDGNVYASEFNAPDALNFRVLRYSGTTGAFMDVFASSNRFVSPAGIVFGPDGNLYVAGLNSDNVVRFDGTTGATIDVFVPSGSGGLDGADYLTFGPDGSLYVASQLTGILRYDGTTGAFLDAFVPLGSGGLGSVKAVLFE